MKKAKTNKESGRRDFVKKAGLGAAAFTIVPRYVLGGAGYRAPSDKLNIAAIGAGGKGRSDIRNAFNDGMENVVALCDIDPQRAGDSIKAWPDAKVFTDFRVMLEEVKEIDAVTISTPDHTHAVAAMTAMDLGKHVYVQKPLTHNIREARMLTEKAAANKIVTQMGNQGASNREQVQMQKWFDEGVIGNVTDVQVWTNRPVWPQGIPVPTETPALPDQISKEAWDLFIGPADFVDYHPLYHPFKWRGWWNFGTGALGDIGCHIIDTPFRVLGLGYPTAVECSVGQIFLQDWTPEYIPAGCPPSSHVQLKFSATEKNKSDLKLTWLDGGLRPMHPDLIPADDFLGSPGSANGAIMTGEKGIMTCGIYGRTPQIYLNNGDKMTMPEDFDDGNPYNKGDYPESGHQKSWTEAVKAGYGSNEHKALTSSFDYSGPMTETVIMGNLAIRSYQQGTSQDSRGRWQFDGRKQLLWDGENMKITNYDAANEFVGRNYRSGWEIS